MIVMNDIVPDVIQTEVGPARDLKDGRVAWLYDLTFGRARICISQRDNLLYYRDGY